MTGPFSPEQRRVLEMALNFIHSATVYLGSVAPIADELDKRMLEGLLELGDICMKRLPQYFLERMTEAACPPGGGPLGGESLERVTASSDLRSDAAKTSSPVAFVGPVKSDSAGEVVTISANKRGLDKLLGPETPVKP